MTTIRRNTLHGIARTAAGLAALALLAGLPAVARPRSSEPLKEAKLNIEHNATDHDTGFQGFIDSEGWQSLDVIGPNGFVLHFDGKGALGDLGLTELFFESVEPENADIPIDQILQVLPAGQYTFRGQAMIEGERLGETSGIALLTHDIPAGPQLIAPAPGETVPAGELLIQWSPVTQSLRGGPIHVIAYQLIVEKDVPPHPHMIGKFGLSMYLPSTVTSISVPRGFLEPGMLYKWEVLAIEESGNQTLSSSEFRTF